MAEQVICYRSRSGKIHLTAEAAEKADKYEYLERLQKECETCMMINGNLHYNGISPLLNYGFNLDTPIRALISKYVYHGSEYSNNIFLEIQKSLDAIKLGFEEAQAKTNTNGLLFNNEPSAP